MAEIARGLGMDVQSVHELGRTGISDPEQLRLAARKGRIFVTRNRNDFLRFTVEFYRRTESHAGTLIVSRVRVEYHLASWKELRMLLNAWCELRSPSQQVGESQPGTPELLVEPDTEVMQRYPRRQTRPRAA